MITVSRICTAIPLYRNHRHFTSIAIISRVLVALFLISVFTFSKKAYDDMGMIHATDAKVSEESQKAIIFHNGSEEVLILGTDLKASKNTGVVRFIPLPSEPTVSLAPNNAFENINALIKTHGLKFLSFSKGGTVSQQAVELHFNEKLGSHDIAVIKVNDASGFRNWVNDFFKKKNLPNKNEYPAIESIVNDYLQRGIGWFVFDFVDITEKVKFIEPVQYRFKTNELYYPLKTSNTVGGIGDIDLILVTPGTVGNPFEPIANCLGIENLAASTSSRMEHRELNSLFPESATFFKSRNIFLQLLTYYGKYEFEKDILADISKARPAAVWDWGQIEGARDNYFNLHFDDKPSYTYEKYSPPENYFTMQVPKDWERTEFDFIKKYDQLECIIHAPGSGTMNYLTIEAAYYADESKTTDRYLYNLKYPQFRTPGEEYSMQEDITIAGRKAQVLDIKTFRYPLPGIDGEKTEALKRYVVISADKGFFVLAFDSPSALAGKYISVFNNILNSFNISDKQQVYHPSKKEISDDDYRVFTDFFTQEKLPAVTFPEYFTSIFNERKVYAITLANKKTDSKTLTNLQKEFGMGITAAFEDYTEKNKAEYLVKDKILMNGLIILSENRLKNSDGIQQNLLGETGGRFKNILFLSRAGFNKAKDAALFYVLLSGSMYTGYFVSMQKQENKWIMSHVEIEEDLIY